MYVDVYDIASDTSRTIAAVKAFDCQCANCEKEAEKKSPSSHLYALGAYVINVSLFWIV